MNFSSELQFKNELNILSHNIHLYFFYFTVCSRAKFVYPVVKQMGGVYFVSHPPPASGAITAFILNVLQSKLNTNNTSLNGKSLTYHWIVEAFKHGFGQKSNSGDPDYVPSVKKCIHINIF